MNSFEEQKNRWNKSGGFEGMNNFRIPPSAAWFVPATCTPNNGLLYIAGNKSSIAYIPPIDQAQSVVRRKLSDADQNAPNVEIIQLTQNR